MFIRRTAGAWSFLAVSIACALLAAPGPKEQAPIPADLKIVAQYGAGYSAWRSWRTSITADGKVNPQSPTPSPRPPWSPVTSYVSAVSRAR